MIKGQTMAIKVDGYIDKRLEEKLGNVRDYVNLKVAELNGQYKALEGQMQGLRDSFEGLRSEVRALGMGVDTAMTKLGLQYDVINHQYEQVIGLLKIVLERTDPEKIGFTKKKE